MSGGLVGSVYICAVLLALALLYFLRATHWYFHGLSVAAALALGLVKMPPEWHSAALDLAIGFLFVLLMVWGLGAPFFRKPRAVRHV